MDYAGISVEFIEGLRISLPDSAVVAWLRLLAWCARRENGGVIEGARSWRRPDWVRACGKDERIVQLLITHGLAAWQGHGGGHGGVHEGTCVPHAPCHDLAVMGYPIGLERKYVMKRALGAKYARLRWSGDRDPSGDPGGNPDGNPDADPHTRKTKRRSKKISPNPLTGARGAAEAAGEPEQSPEAITARVIGRLNAGSGLEFELDTDAVERLLDEGRTERELRLVVWHMTRCWADDEKRRHMLRPSVIFARGKFGEYLTTARDEYKRLSGKDPFDVDDGQSNGSMLGNALAAAKQEAGEP